MVKLREVDVHKYLHNPYRYAMDALESTVDGSTRIAFNPYTENGGKFELIIEFNHINFSDYVMLKTALHKSKYIDDIDYEISHIMYSDYYSQEELNQMVIPFSHKRINFYSCEVVKGNLYRVSDIYGSDLEYHLYFLYIEDIEKYVVVKICYFGL